MGEVLVLGAGIAGLSLARVLTGAGVPVRLLDKGKKPGGRCATRRFGAVPFDYGPVFLHGSDPEFVGHLKALSGGWAEGWPVRISGHGPPCQPGSLERSETRLAPFRGVNALAAALAEGLPITLNTEVTDLRLEGGRLIARGGEGEWSATTLISTLPAPQAQKLLLPLPGRAAQTLGALLEMLTPVPCLTLALLYPQEAPDPGYDVHYPAAPGSLSLIADERRKRPDAEERVVVLQASPGWSAAHLQEPAEVWSQRLIEEARPHHPALAEPPRAQHPHRWRYARLPGGPGLGGPLLLSLENGARLGLAGEAFDPRGGIEGAYRSGRALGQRLLREPEGTP